MKGQWEEVAIARGGVFMDPRASGMAGFMKGFTDRLSVEPLDTTTAPCLRHGAVAKTDPRCITARILGLLLERSGEAPLGDYLDSLSRCQHLSPASLTGT